MKILEDVLIEVEDKDIPADGHFIIPDTVKAIGPRVFERCQKLIVVTIPQGVTCIGNAAFMLCSNLQSVSLPASLTAIGEEAFWLCTNLSALVIPPGLTTIGRYAFFACAQLTTITIPQGVTCIEDGIFRKCFNLHSVSLPAGLITIANDAFRGCSNLSALIVPRGVGTIWRSAFSECTKLTTITIPQGVRIAAWVFNECYNLSIVVIDADTSEALQGVKNELPKVLQDRVLSKEEYEILQQKKQHYLTNHFLELIAKKHIKSLSEVLSPIIAQSFFSVMSTDLLNTVTPYVIELHPDYQKALSELAMLEIPVVRDDEGAINWKVYQKQFSVELAAYFSNPFLPTNAKQTQPASHDVSVEVTKELPDARANRL